MQKAFSFLQRGQKAVADLNLLNVLQSEIQHEISQPRFQDVETGSLGDFKVDWDSNQCQDTVLSKKCDSGQEVAVSALLGEETEIRANEEFPREVVMKVCIKKPGLHSILQFDCRVFELDYNKADFDIQNAYHLRFPTSARASHYWSPSSRILDPKLQGGLKQYLISVGISQQLTNFILYHLHKKEQDQYVDWLHKLESMVGKSQEDV